MDTEVYVCVEEGDRYATMGGCLDLLGKFLAVFQKESRSSPGDGTMPVVPRDETAPDLELGKEGTK